MDKEKIVTIVLGLIVGVGLAAAYFFGSKYLPGLVNKSKPTAAMTSKVDAKKPAAKVTDQTQNVSLTITAPQDNSATTEDTITVSGSYSTGSEVILFANADQKIATSNAQGKFSFSVTLEGGENEITINSFDSLGKLISVKRNVTLEVSE